MREHLVRAEPAGQRGLGVEARHDRDRHLRVERPQHRERTQAEGARPVHEDPAAGGGGCRVIACSDTENGSANTATSSGTESGTANSMLSWAGISSA